MQYSGFVCAARCVVGALARARSAEESVLAFTCAVVRGWQCETQSDMDVRAGMLIPALERPAAFGLGPLSGLNQRYCPDMHV